MREKDQKAFTHVDNTGDSTDSRTGGQVAPDAVTERPWQSFGPMRREASVGGFIVIGHPNHEPVAYVADRDAANFVLTACNSHEALVSALQEIVDDAVPSQATTPARTLSAAT